MAEEDCDIEYLDEDEDLIQQFVQQTPVVEKKPIITTPVAESEESTDAETEESLLVARKRSERSDIKRKIKSEDDSDYDPSEEFRQAAKKRIRNVKNPPYTQTQNKPDALSASSLSQDAKPAQKPDKHDIQERRKKGIRIPDFEDPLCLSAKAIVKTKSDLQKWKYWNKVCLDHYKKNLDPFRPAEDLVVSSSRCTIFRKVTNKATGHLHTTVWTKINVEDSKGKEKSEVRQYTLPYYREKLLLKPYVLTKCTPRRFSHKHEVLLTKETVKDEDFLVAYNTGDAVAAVYKDLKQDETALDDAENKRLHPVIKETTCNKICAPCYQTSWRGVRKQDISSMPCPICKRNVVSVYNLLAHVKTYHKTEEVRRHKAALARSLASVVDYHYKCRICQETFLSIKLLRKHVAKHQGEEPFHCEIGNHDAK